MLITLLNDGTLIAIGYDHVEPPSTPTIWNLRVLFVIGTVLAGVACLSSLLLLKLSLESWQENSFYQIIGLGGISYGQITTSIFLKVAVSDFLTLFSARAGENWFWTSTPAPILIAAGSLALTMSTIVACIWPMSRPDGIPTLGLERKEPYALPIFIWIYCLVWWIIQVIIIVVIIIVFIIIIFIIIIGSIIVFIVLFYNFIIIIIFIIVLYYLGCS
jgi:H+-transporting ATPase